MQIQKKIVFLEFQKRQSLIIGIFSNKYELGLKL